MPCLSGFELYSRWVPLFCFRRFQKLCLCTASFVERTSYKGLFVKNVNLMHVTSEL